MDHNRNPKRPAFWAIVRNLDIIISGLALTALVLITFLGVIARRVFNSPFAWQEEMQVFCTLWLVFIASGAVFRTIDHISIELLVDALGPKLKRIVELFVYVVVMATLAFTLYRSYLLVEQLYVTERLTNILKIPYYLVYIPFPIGCVLMMASDTAVTAQRLFGKRETNTKEEEAEPDES